jgi:tetratricopeptide (TPR) repeat protein
LYFYGKYKEAAKEFKRHLELPTAVWRPERAASLRYLAICEPENAVTHLVKAVATDQSRRESKVALAEEYYKTHDWQNCLKWALEALEIKEKPLDYMCEEFAWGELPWDLAAISSYWLGDKEAAARYGAKAVELNPADSRLQENMKFYTAS